MTFCFPLWVAAHLFCQRGFIRNKAACETVGSSASLRSPPAHSAAHRACGLRKGARRQSLSSLMGSERLRFHRASCSSNERMGETGGVLPGKSRLTYCILGAEAARSVPGIGMLEHPFCRVELSVTCLSLSRWKADPGDVCFGLSNFKQLSPQL